MRHVRTRDVVVATDGPEGLLERLERVRAGMPDIPLVVFGWHPLDDLLWRERDWRLPTVPFGSCKLAQPVGKAVARELVDGLSRAGHEPVEIEEASDPLRRAVDDAGDDRAAVAVACEHDRGQLLGLEHRDDVGDMSVEVGLRPAEMTPFAEPGQGWPIDLVSERRQAIIDEAPFPAATPAAMDEHERR